MSEFNYLMNNIRIRIRVKISIRSTLVQTVLWVIECSSQSRGWEPVSVGDETVSMFDWEGPHVALIDGHCGDVWNPK